MFFLFLMFILVAWFSVDRVIQKWYNTSIRGWKWPKPENIIFTVIFYALLVTYIVFPFIFPTANLFLAMPFAFASFHLLFAIQQLIYNRENKQYLHYILDTIGWGLLGITAYIFFG